MDRFLKRTLPPNKNKSEDELEVDTVSPEKKKMKRLSWDQKFRPEYRNRFPFMKSSPRGATYGYCLICQAHVSVRCGGLDDLRKHVSTAKHMRNAEDQSGPGIASFMEGKANDYSVIGAETQFVQFLLENNIPLAVADKFGPVLKKMVPDSAIAKKYACGRTKASAVAHVYSNEVVKRTVNSMNNYAYSLATDGSADNEAKLYPIVVRAYDETVGKIVTSLLSVPDLHEASTGKNIAILMMSELDKAGVSTENLLAFTSDNASVMIGEKNGVVSHLKESKPSLLSVGCSCHLLNLAAKKASSELPIQTDELLLDVYYYFLPSDKRLREFKDRQLLHNEETRKILKYCPTRWLSLTKCLRRLIELWNPLRDYIEDMYAEEKRQAEKKAVAAAKRARQKDAGGDIINSWFSDKTPTSGKSSDSVKSTAVYQANARLKRLKEALNSKRTLAYCTFLSWIMPSFDNANTALQHEKPMIHKVRSVFLGLYRDLLTRLVRPKAIMIHGVLDLSSVDLLEKANEIPDSDMYYGNMTQKLVEKMSSSSRADFHEATRTFYRNALSYMKKKFPLNEPLFCHASVVDIDKRLDVTYKDLTFFTERMPLLDQDALHQQFRLYQSAELPPEVLQADRADVQWHIMRSYHDPGTGNLSFKELATAMLAILCIPHSNADAERTFSMVKKNRTDSRSCLSTVSLQSVLVAKFAKDHPIQLTDDVLKRCKSATYQHLQN